MRSRRFRPYVSLASYGMSTSHKADRCNTGAPYSITSWEQRQRNPEDRPVRDSRKGICRLLPTPV